MPAQIQFIDPEAYNSPMPGQSEPLPITLGPSWQANDIRLVFNIFSNYYYYGNNIWGYYGPNPFPPAGFTVGHDPGGSSLAHQNEWAAWRRLTASDVDNRAISWQERYWLFFGLLMITARGVDRASSPTFVDVGVTQLQTPSRIRFPSVTVPGAGVMLLICLTGNGSGQWSTGQSPDVSTVPTTGSSLGVPAGWTPIVATEKSGSDYYPYDTNTGMIVLGKYFSAAGSTGTVDVPCAYTSGAIVTGQVSAYGFTCYLKPAPDVTTSGTAATSIVAAGGTAGTVTIGNSPTSAGTPADPIAVAGGQGFNPCYGQFTGTVLLPGDPVTSSLVAWEATVPTGAALTVETSLNNGLSWDRARNNQPVPRLLEGNRSTRQVLIRATMTRLSHLGPKPVLHKLRLRIPTDSGVFEYLPIGYGVIDEPKLKISPSPSSSNAGGAGVKTRGGGQMGGGPLLKIHAVDPSRLMKLAGWQMPYIIPIGKNYVDAAVDMVKDRLPWLTRFSTVSTSRVVEGSPLIYGLDQQQDPWKDFQELLGAIGYEGFFRPDGTLRIQPIPDPRYQEPVWTIAIGRSWITEVERVWSDEFIKNCIIVEGESTSSKNPVSALAQDDDPTSDTSIYGRLGLRTQRGKFPHINTTAQAQIAATGILYNSLGLGDTIRVSIPPIPVFETGDPVKLVVPQVKSLGVYVIQSMDTPAIPGGDQQLDLFKQMAHT